MKEKDSIESLRDKIDELDRALTKLLNERAELAVRIGKVKKQLGLQVYSPEREEEIMRHVEEMNDGPLSTSAMKRLFERIIDESRSIEREGMEGKDPRTKSSGNVSND